MLAVAYTDGSYRDVPNIGGVYSGACIIASDSQEGHTLLSKADNNADYLPFRNIAGEITAVIMACQHCLTQLHMKQGDTLLIRHDYVGLDYWTRPKNAEGYWRAKTDLTLMYRDYMNTKVKTIINVRFEHVQGHSSDTLNDVVDTAAKKAIDNFVNSLEKMSEDGKVGGGK